MKKLLTTLAVIAIAAGPFSASARNIDAAQARHAAAYFMSVYSGHGQVPEDELTLVNTIENPELGIPACYFFNIGDWGWIIMTGSAAFDPVVAFSDRCGGLDPNNMSEGMKAYVNEFANMVIAVQNADAKEDFADNDEWTAIWKEDLQPASKAGEHYLMDETWDQGESDGSIYNSQCPQVDGAYCYVGCVATALSQIIHYYKFPVKPFGYHSYSWNNTSLRMNYDELTFDYSLMPNKLTQNSSAAQKAEVAKLCYAVAVSIDMSFGTSGSGAYSHNVPNSMASYFKYKTCTQVAREQQNNDTAFCGKIRRELMLNRPIYMSGGSSTNSGGQDAAGHAWVVCGYREDRTSFYWFNWGWSGSDDGWYNLVVNDQSAMYLASSRYTFNLRQTAMIGLIPPHADSSAVDFMPHTQGINTVPTAELLPAYPNPASHSINIPYRLSSSDELTILTVEGKAIIRKKIEEGEGEARIDLGAMPAGIYIYRLGGASGKFIVK